MNEPLRDPVGREIAAQDGVRLAILSKRFESVARKMANTLLRTGRSGVLNTGRDFSCCVVTADHELVTAAECYPIHVLRGADLMSQAMKQFHPVVAKGDAFLHNSPYHGNTHAADHVILVPVVDDAGTHQFTVLVKAHMADCGNSIPTTYMGNARDVYHEGALIFPAVKIQQGFRDNEDILRMCEMRIRVPEQWRGDYMAMLGAARLGEQEIEKIGREMGWETLRSHTREWFDYSEARMLGAIRRMRSGRAVATSAGREQRDGQGRGQTSKLLHGDRHPGPGSAGQLQRVRRHATVGQARRQPARSGSGASGVPLHDPVRAAAP